MPGQGRRRCCEAVDGTHRHLGRGRGALLEPAVLAALADSEAHGYDVRKSIEDMTDGQVSADPGGLYRLLRRMEEDSLVVSTWVEGESGPQRRQYMLTAEGRGLLEHWLDHLRERERVLSLLVTAVERVVAKD